jgi:hypothetical protein
VVRLALDADASLDTRLIEFEPVGPSWTRRLSALSLASS